MGWPEAFVIVGACAAIAFITWVLMHYSRTTVEVKGLTTRRKEDKPT